jgi:hypothetical protein
MTRIAKFFKLTHLEQGIFLRAWFLLGSMRMCLWMLPFESVQQLVKRYQQAPETATDVDTLKRAILATSRYVPRCTCLVQALAMSLLLKRYGHASDLHIGVARNEEGKFMAHAWVERQGQVVIGGPNVEQYTRFSPRL